MCRRQRRLRPENTAYEQTWFQQETTLSQVRFAHFQAIVSLYQALGGGWQLDLAEGVPSRGRESMRKHPQ
jgi:hypothetical protein